MGAGVIDECMGVQYTVSLWGLDAFFEIVHEASKGRTIPSEQFLLSVF
ncbi:hypothetical protein KSC_033030 [Ktedonobacter sp. SOSP1-52]|nr:hypothetical protein KSC_033030 [Ktedonobacter sp. SOSP1-52]